MTCRHRFPPCIVARGQRGFSLVESLVVLVVTSLLLTLAAPSLAALQRRTRVASSAEELLAAVVLARSEAIKRNAHVALCKSGDGVSCARSGGWHQGWVVFEDANGNGALDAGEPVVARREPLAPGLLATGNNTVSAYVSYTPQGVAKLVGGGFQAGTITVCSPMDAAGQARQVIINAGGRPRLQKGATAPCP